MYGYVLSDSVNRIDPRGTFLEELGAISLNTVLLGFNNTVIEYHSETCTKLSDVADRCACHCVYASDNTKCEDECKQCEGAAKLTPKGICECSCKAYGGKQCDLICGSLSGD